MASNFEQSIFGSNPSTRLDGGIPDDNAGDPVNEPVVPKKKKKPVSPEVAAAREAKRKEREEKIRVATEYLNRIRGPMLDVLAQDNTLKYKAGSGFLIRLEEGIIEFGLPFWEYQKNYDFPEDGIKFGFCHEIAHFLDLREDPQGLLDNFKYTTKKGKAMAQEIRQWYKIQKWTLPAWTEKEYPLDPKDKTRGTINALTLFFRNKLNEFYNCLDDIHVNKRVGLAISGFNINKDSEGRQQTAPSLKRVYRDFLFPTTRNKEKFGLPPEPGEPCDLTKDSECMQFAYYLLRKKMVPDQEILVSPKVKELLNSKLKIGNRVSDKSIIEAVDYYTRAVPGNIASKRYAAIKALIEPIFYNLFMDDIKKNALPKDPPKQEKGDPDDGDGEGEGGDGEEGDDSGGSPDITNPGEDKPQEGEDGEGEGKPGEGEPEDGKPGDGDGEPKDGEKKPGEDDTPGKWDSRTSSGPLDEKTIEDFMKAQAKKRAKDSKEQRKEQHNQRMSDEQLADKAQQAADKAFAEANGIDPGVMKEYALLKKSVEPYKDELKKFFKKLAQQIQMQFRDAMIGFFRHGKMDLQRFIRKHGHTLNEEVSDILSFEDLPFHLQRELIPKFKFKPDELRFRFIIDNSGSMGNKEGDTKLNRTRQLLVLFLEAMADFENDIALMFKSYGLKHPPMILKTQIVTFDAKSVEAKPLGLESKLSIEQEKAARVVGFSKLDGSGGDTIDHTAWDIVASTTRADDKNRIMTGCLRDIALEVTDGGVSDSGRRQKTIRIVNRLMAEKMVCRAFQIVVSEMKKGDPVAPGTDAAYFDDVWGVKGEKGEPLGERIYGVEEIVPTFMGMLKSELEKTKFTIEYDEDEDDD